MFAKQSPLQFPITRKFLPKKKHALSPNATGEGRSRQCPHVPLSAVPPPLRPRGTPHKAPRHLALPSGPRFRAQTAFLEGVFVIVQHFLQDTVGESPRSAVPRAGAAPGAAASIKRGAGGSELHSLLVDGDIAEWATGWSTTGSRPPSL